MVKTFIVKQKQCAEFFDYFFSIVDFAIGVEKMFSDCLVEAEFFFFCCFNEKIYCSVEAKEFFSPQEKED